MSFSLYEKIPESMYIATSSTVVDTAFSGSSSDSSSVAIHVATIFICFLTGILALRGRGRGMRTVPEAVDDGAITLASISCGDYYDKDVECMLKDFPSIEKIITVTPWGKRMFHFVDGNITCTCHTCMRSGNGGTFTVSEFPVHMMESKMIIVSKADGKDRTCWDHKRMYGVPSGKKGPWWCKKCLVYYSTRHHPVCKKST